MNEILEFINRRFTKDCDWTCGNCYYFALILKDRFPAGEIYYDVVLGHFVFYYDGIFYDWNGIADIISVVLWNEFYSYDKFQKERIIRDCIL